MRLEGIYQVLAASVLLSPLGMTGGCAGVGAGSASMLAVAGQAMTGRSEDITRYDVYQNQAIWDSYRRDATYQVKRDLFYGRLYSNSLHLDDLIKPSHPLNTIPRSIDSYLMDPAKWPGIKGIVGAGTKLHVSRVLYMQDLNIHDFYYIGVFDNGPMAGREVLLNEISLNRGLGNPRVYDPELLERETDR